MRPLKLAALKHAINAMVPVLLKMAPAMGPGRPISLFTTRLFNLLLKALNLAPERFYKDKNFSQLLRALSRTLVFISEEDGHYAGQLAQAFLLIHDIVQESRRQFPPGAEGDVAWMHWASGQPILRVQPNRPEAG